MYPAKKQQQTKQQTYGKSNINHCVAILCQLGSLQVPLQMGQKL